MLGIPAHAYAQAQEVLVLGDPHYQPYESCAWYSPSASGILVDQWKLMGERSGIRVTYGCDNWAKAQDRVLRGEADALGGMIPSDERRKKYRFVARLVKNPPIHFYFDQNDFSDPRMQLATVVDAGVVIGAVDGDYATDEWLPHHYPTIRLRLYPNYLSLAEAARDERVNVFVMEESVASKHLSDLGITQRFTRSAEPLFQAFLWAAVKRENTALANQLEEAFARVGEQELLAVERQYVEPQGLMRRAVGFVRVVVSGYGWYALLAAWLMAEFFVVGLVYWSRPLAIYRLSVAIRRFDIEIGIPKMPKLTLRYVLLVGFLDTSPRVLDALLRTKRDRLAERFQQLKTVNDRRAHYTLPFVFDGKHIETPGVQERRRQLAARLRSVFEGRGACVVILGDGGSGKTSLACWICRHALELIHGEERIFPHLTVPVFIEGTVDGALLATIGAKVNGLLGEDLPREALLELLRSGRILVVVDGASEMDDETCARLRAPDPTTPLFLSVVTARREVQLFHGAAAVELRPQRLAGTLLSGFLEFWLHELKVRQSLSDPQFFEVSKELSQLVDGRPVSPLLVWLYAQMLASRLSQDNATLDTPRLVGIADLFWHYVNGLNRQKDGGRPDPEVHRALKRVAWECCTNYVPRRCSREAAARAIGGDGAAAEAMIHYLETRLALVETIQPAQRELRFVLDPLAEYFAADLVLDGEAAFRALEAFIAHIELDENLAACRGFAEALATTGAQRNISGYWRSRIDTLAIRLRQNPSLDALTSAAPHGVASDTTLT